MITQVNLKAQVSTQEFQRRQITVQEMVMLRDYEIAAAVLSWDNFSFDTPNQITPADITNIAFKQDIVWYQINYHRSIPIHIETFLSHWSHIQECSQTKEPNCSPPANKTGIAGDSVSVKLLQQVKAFATVAEWEEARNLIPAGYRLKDGWFYDSNGGRCNLPPTKLSPRQIDILIGAVPVR